MSTPNFRLEALDILSEVPLIGEKPELFIS
jgi:hypothetical protein